MTLNKRLSDLLRTMRDEVLDFDGRLNDEQRAETGLPDAWSAKDEVAHCMVWAGRTLDDIQAAAAGEPAPEPESDDFNEENRIVFVRHRDDTWEQVKKMVEGTYGRAIAFVDGKAESDLLAHPEGLEYPVWREIAGSYISHTMFHIWEYLEKHGYASEIPGIFGEQFFERVIALHDDPGWRGTAYYNLACQDALNGNSEQAIAYLSQALHYNPNLIEWSQQDSDLDSLRELDAFKALYDG